MRVFSLYYLHMQRPIEKAILVGIITPRIRKAVAEEHLAELKRLAETAGAIVTRTFLQRVQAFNPATLIGEGKVAEIYVQNGQAVEYGQPLFRIV